MDIKVLLNNYSSTLGKHEVAYQNHCLRVLEFIKCLEPSIFEKYEREVVYALAFHDLGIWTSSFDYINPSVELALSNDVTDSQLNMELVKLLIEEHHRISKYQGKYSNIVNLFIKADLIDLSLNIFNFGISKKKRNEIKSKYPYLGFHAFLLKKAFLWIIKNPLRPLPMFKW